MYNINLYSYWKKPFTKGKNFTIHPLDEPGKEKYFSKESHCARYFKRTDPFVFKSILGTDYNTLINQQQEDINTLNNIKSKRESKTINKNIETDNHKSNYLPTEEDEKNIDNSNFIQNNRYNTCGNESELEKTKQFKNFKSQKLIRPYHRKKNFKDIYGYENIYKYKTKPERYMNIINNIKYANISEDKNRYKRKYDGFTTYEIPLINVNNKEIKNDSFSTRLKHTLDCLKKTDGGRNAMNEEELKLNLFNQTSKQFLKKYHLPDVIKIASSTQLIRRQKIGLSKEMGEKYNPYSLIPPSKNRIGRNYVGDLFKH